MVVDDITYDIDNRDIEREMYIQDLEEEAQEEQDIADEAEEQEEGYQRRAVTSGNLNYIFFIE